MKRLPFILTLLFILSLPLCAGAIDYTDNINNISASIPEGDNVYYYTPESNNLFSDLAEKISNDERDIRLFVSAYSDDNELLYSLTVYASDAIDPQSSDVGDMTAEDQQLISEQAETYTNGAFSFSSPDVTTFSNTPAIKAEGTGDSENTANQCDIYIMANQNQMLITEIQYNSSTEDAGLTSLLGSLRYGQAATASSVASVDLDTGDSPASDGEAPLVQLPTEAPAEDAATEPDSQPTPTMSPTSTSGFFGGLTDKLSSAYQNDPNFVYYAAGLLAILALVIFLILFARHRSKRKHTTQQEQAAPVQQQQQPPEATPQARSPEPGAAPPVAATKPAAAPMPPAEDATDAPQPVRKRLLTVPPSGKTEYGLSPQEYVPLKNDEPESPPVPTGSRVQRRHQEYEPGGQPQQVKNVPVASQTVTENVTPPQPSKEDIQVNELNKDFTEDISRYTQQPGREVNDISRNTLGGYTATDEELQNLAAAAKEATNIQRATPEWKTAGSRSERYHKKKKR